MKSFDEVEQEMGISPSSPEAYYAEKAWNIALHEAAKFALSEPQGGLIASVITESITELGYTLP